VARVPVPESVNQEMRLWRLELVPMPQSYIDFQGALAAKALEELKTQGLEVLSTELKSDGWFDGMQALKVRAIQKVGRIERIIYLTWCDSNQEFFVNLTVCGGSVPFRMNEFAN